jgi:hypothetical protein
MVLAAGFGDICDAGVAFWGDSEGVRVWVRCAVWGAV